MMIRMTSMLLFIVGVMLWLMSKIIPLLTIMGMDYVAIMMMGGSLFILLFCFSISETGKQYDTLPPGGALINFIRRDGHIIPLIGKRIFSGESFLEIPKLGLIEDLGKDTVFTWGRKRVRFGLENINYTPDPRFWNLTRELYRMGFDNNEDLYNILNIPNMNSKEDKIKKVYYLERMGRIYWGMTHDEPRQVQRLMGIFQKKPRKKISYGKQRHYEKKTEEKPVETRRVDTDYNEIDRIIGRR